MTAEFNYSWDCPYCDEKGKTFWTPYAKNAVMPTHIKEKHLDEAFNDLTNRYTDEGKKQFIDEHSDFYKIRVKRIPKCEV